MAPPPRTKPRPSAGAFRFPPLFSAATTTLLTLSVLACTNKLGNAHWYDCGYDLSGISGNFVTVRSYYTTSHTNAVNKTRDDFGLAMQCRQAK